MSLIKEAVELYIYVKCVDTNNGKRPDLPDIIPQSIIDCLYQQDAIYTYIDDVCRIRLIAKKSELDKLKSELSMYQIVYDNDFKEHFSNLIENNNIIGEPL